MLLKQLERRLRGQELGEINQPELGIPAPPPAILDPFLAIYPPIVDNNFANFKFFQVNRGEFATPQTGFIWEITGSVGPGVFQEASGFDIRPFVNSDLPTGIENAVDNNNTFDPVFVSGFLQVVQLSDDQLHLFCWEFGGNIHEWILSAPHVFPADGTPSDNEFTDPEGNGRDIFFADNGTKMLTCGTDDNIIRLYSLPTPNSFSTTPVLLDSFDLDFIPSMLTQSCHYSRDGTKLYSIDGDSDRLLQWNLVTPFTLPAPSTPPDRTFPYNPLVTESNGNSRMFPDGSEFYLMSAIPDRMISRYKNTDGLNQIPTVNKDPDAFLDVASFDTNPRAISVSTDGSLIWFSGRQNNTVFELFVLPSLLEYDVAFVNVTTGDFKISVIVPTIEDLTFVQMAVGNPTAIDGSTSFRAVFSGNELNIAPEDGFVSGVTISTDGLTLFMLGSDNDKIFQYDLSIANDLSTAVLSANELNILPQDTNARGITISADGMTLFMGGEENNKIFQYDFSTANDLSTAVVSSNELDISTEDLSMDGVTISSDGLTLFMSGTENDKIYQYNLSTANDLSTASFSGNELDIASKVTFEPAITISADGMTLFLTGGTAKIFQLNFSTANDLSTASFSGNELDISTEDFAPRGITVSSNGLAIFIGGNLTNKILQYDMTVPNSLETGIALSTFETPLLTQGEDNFLVNEVPNNIAARQS
ncbi:MAG: hypothetical protein O6761_06910 [Thaumarchaeota archaeon]|nr:hypothetical protein [Nitrososphaerota archaeon]